MGRAYVRWAVTHPDYYQVMFGSELDKTESPELLAAGVRAFDDLLDAIVRCQESGLFPQATRGVWQGRFGHYCTVFRC